MKVGKLTALIPFGWSLFSCADALCLFSAPAESDTLVGYEENSAFERGIPCYADNMCDRCFLPESREGLFGSLCDPKTWTCKVSPLEFVGCVCFSSFAWTSLNRPCSVISQGYDASHQTKVASHKVLHALIGRFVHDTPDPQEDYRAAIDAALRLADMDVSKPRELPRMQAKALRLLYESFNGQECNNNWIASLAEAGETELVVEN